MQLENALSTTIRLGFYALFLIVPLIFLPGHVELFQFNKIMAVYFLTTFITTAWAIRMILRRKVEIRRTPLDLPLLLFFASQVISSLFSIEPHTSLWGYYSRFHGGLLSTISYILLYYAFVSTMGKQTNPRRKPGKPWKTCLHVLLVSATTLSLYGILEHFGIDEHYWVQDVRLRVFSTMGQPNWLAAFLVAVIPISLALSLSEKRKFGIWNLEFGIFYLTLLYTKSRSGLLGFSVMYLAFWTLLWLRAKGIERRARNSPRSKLNAVRYTLNAFLKSSLIIALISALVGTPFSPSVSDLFARLRTKNQSPISQQSPTQPENQPSPQAVKPSEGGPVPRSSAKQSEGGTESSEIRKIVWKGALRVWRNWPLTGSGVETFAYSYYNFRPVEHNFVSEWDFLYNKAHNEYLNILATTGLLGLATLLFFMGTFFIWSLQQIKNGKWKMENGKSVSTLYPLPSTLLPAFLSGFLGLSVTNFFGFSTVADALLFYLFPAFSLLASDKRPTWLTLPLLQKNEGWQKTIRYLVIAVVLVLNFAILMSLGKRWYADRLFARGTRLSDANRMSEALSLMQRASSLVPDEPLFHDRLGLDFARTAVALFQTDTATEASQVASIAVAHSDLTNLLNPVHLTYLKNRAATFLHLAVLDPKFEDEALKTLLHAAELSPTDPKLPYNLGLLYGQRAQWDKAVDEFQKSIALKPDWELPHLALARFYLEQGELDKVESQYRQLLSHDPDNVHALSGLADLATRSAGPPNTP